MAYSLGLYAFSDGELSAFDLDAVRAVLSPVAAVPERVIDGATESGFAPPTAARPT
ncbi:hypothetical protein AB0P07_19885 [Streptomyces sp. NPDC085944]|uniref:hypothetical protein n=1 Tax=Streptomyces sp. NPDC085944 TaxID=3154962 RepID=UPI00343D1D44